MKARRMTHSIPPPDPWALGLPAKPVVARCEFAGGELRHQHRACVAQHFDDTRVVVQHLILQRRRSPGGLVTLDRDDVLRAPRDSVQRSLVFARRDFRISLLRLRPRLVVQERHDVIELRVVTMQPLQIHLGQLERRDFLRSDQFREMADGPESHVLEIRRPAHRRRRAQPERPDRLVHLDARHE